MIANASPLKVYKFQSLEFVNFFIGIWYHYHFEVKFKTAIFIICNEP